MTASRRTFAPIGAIALLLLSLGEASALRVAARWATGNARAPAVAMCSPKPQCAVIELRSDNPANLAKVLRKAWMEGGMKRGLTGAVVVPEEGTGMVQVIAQGPIDRVNSFGSWCEKQLDIEEGKVDVIEMDLEQCPAIPLSSKFDLADMPRGKANDPWRQLLQKSYDDTSASATKLHSSDEGLA